MKLNDIYTAVRQDTSATTLGGIRIVPVNAKDDTGLFAGVRSTSGANLLLLRCSPPAAIRPAKLPSCQAFQTRVVTYDEPASATTWIELEQKKTRHSVQFLDMAASIVAHVEACHSLPSRAGVFIDCVKEWRDAFTRTGGGYLSREEQVGLYSELWFLGSILLPHVTDPSVAVRAWTGPTGTPPLYVCFLQVEEAQARGETLGARVATLREALKGLSCLNAFEQRLRKAKYRDAHRIYYDVRGYVYSSHSFFAVANGFPCFQPNDLKDGMCDIKYSLQVGALAPFRVSQDDVVEQLKQPGLNHPMQRTGAAVTPAAGGLPPSRPPRRGRASRAGR